MAKKVLIVDDDPTLLGVVGEHVSIAGYETRTTTDGLIAIRIAHEWKPDLILLDIMMPETDGYTVAKRIRETSSVPIIILSAKGKEVDKLQAFNLGVDDYIVKPFSPAELLARLRAVFRRSEEPDLEAHHDKFQQGDLTVDTKACRVLKSGREIELSVLQYKLLATMATQMGEVISPEELLGAVWGREHKGEKTKLRLAISRLKQRIEEDPRNPVHIITVPRVGYVMPKEPGGSYHGKRLEPKGDTSNDGINGSKNA